MENVLGLKDEIENHRVSRYRESGRVFALELMPMACGIRTKRGNSELAVSSMCSWLSADNCP